MKLRAIEICGSEIHVNQGVGVYPSEMEAESDFQIKEERIDLEDLIIPSKVGFVK